MPQGERINLEKQLEIIKLYMQEKMTVSEVAAKAGVSHGGAMNVLRKHNIPRRSRREYAEIQRAEEAEAIRKLLAEVESP